MFLGDSFAVAGTVSLAASKKSLAVEMVNLWGKYYVSVKDIQEVISGHKKTATIWIPKK